MVNNFNTKNNNFNNSNPGILSEIIIVLAHSLIIITFPLSVWFCFRTINEYERAIVFRLGRILQNSEKGPGLIFINPLIDNYIIMDLRVLSFIVPQQEILSKDSVTVSVDAVVYFRVCDSIKAVTNIEDYKNSTQLLAQTVLRNITGTKTLSELLSYKENISQQLQVILDDATEHWGVQVQRVELKDVCIPESLQRAMAAEGEATREAKARIIAADGEKEASKALKEAADIISENKNAIQLRYLQTLSHIGQDNSTTIIFPFPVEFLSSIKNLA
ncbi:Band 7 protein family and Stomatin family-containing protein [Strongyloides ratti]|uniref:Band 7 protein family and Stomatin family-containing protein n=1 Tax=Strongyloides ratti TaxID=34506 RepID=A0A090N006_STRRB|nr:Band 7 protein family and Stomatin family-containing protein [Strongyloides ratti]CEF69850.1 Band 7 protein family and Stomatin family-containing protein [Strongyloides ratti]